MGFSSFWEMKCHILKHAGLKKMQFFFITQTSKLCYVLGF